MAGPPLPPANAAFFQALFFCHIPILRAVSGHVYGTWVILNPLVPALSPLCPQSKQAYDQVLAQAQGRYKKDIVSETRSPDLFGGGLLPPTAH